jgi:transcriptional regulator with XRE-family HTH domain
MMDHETEELEPHNKRGPKGPSKILTDQDFNMLLSMVRIQCTQTEICEILGMSDTTLNRRLKERDYENFEDLYKKHNSEGKMSLRRFQWKAAENGNATMQIWLGKQYLGQRDKINAELTGENGGPIITRVESFFVEPPSSD